MAIDFENMEYIIVVVIILQFFLTMYLTIKVSRTSESYDRVCDSTGFLCYDSINVQRVR